MNTCSKLLKLSKVGQPQHVWNYVSISGLLGRSVQTKKQQQCSYPFLQECFTEAALSDVLQNRCSWKFCNIHREACVLESLINKTATMKACNFIKKRLQHRCFTVNIAKFLRISFFIEHLWWLVLAVSTT